MLFVYRTLWKRPKKKAENACLLTGWETSTNKEPLYLKPVSCLRYNGFLFGENEHIISPVFCIWNRYKGRHMKQVQDLMCSFSALLVTSTLVTNNASVFLYKNTEAWKRLFINKLINKHFGDFSFRNRYRFLIYNDF